MACPNVANDEISMFKTGRERTGAGYDSSYNLSTPIYMSDLQRLSGGQSSGSGHNYPAVNTLNPIESRPDGENPLQFSEFSQYNQNVTRTAFQYVYSATSSNNACAFAIPSGLAYFHTDVNNLVPDAGGGQYTAYTTVSGTTVVPAGYYAIYSNDNFPTASGKYIQVGSNGSILAVGNC
tara:strand:+ start:3653 stop:4189 length:537 start_codon:yes stop_codon:yes gene_type:complete